MYVADLEILQAYVEVCKDRLNTVTQEMMIVSQTIFTIQTLQVEL